MAEMVNYPHPQPPPDIGGVGEGNKMPATNKEKWYDIPSLAPQGHESVTTYPCR
jgi:hypothetical protein